MKKTTQVSFIWLVLSLGVIFFFRWQVEALFRWQYPRLTQLVPTPHFATDLALLSQGSHRLAADITYIQLLQYYGVPEQSHSHDDHEHHDHEHQNHKGRKETTSGFSNHLGDGIYSQLLTYGKRILRLDPFFNGAILEVAGALAFNIQRTEEARELLREAIERDPTFYRYRLYVAAILFRQEGQDRKLLSVLEEAIQYSDCPPLLENILANLYKKYGQFEDALKVYGHMIKTVQEKNPRQDAQRNLVALLHEHPKLVPLAERLLQD